jgi:hypothetical protein
MNTKDLTRLGVPLGEATWRATDFISKFILGSRDPDGVVASIIQPSHDFAPMILPTRKLRQQLSPNVTLTHSPLLCDPPGMYKNHAPRHGGAIQHRIFKAFGLPG